VHTANHGTPDRRWSKILGEYLSRFGIVVPESPAVLDIGCGNNAIWNYLALISYLSERALGFPQYVGVDMYEEAFSKAREGLEGLATFIACDARELSRHVEGPFHLILCQHPPLTTSKEGPRIWQAVFEEAARVLDPEGCFVLTSFWVNDHIPAQVAVQKAGLEILYSGKNAYPGKIFDKGSDGEDLQYDKYILLARKPRS